MSNFLIPKRRWALLFFLVVLLIPIGSSFLKYFYTKDFDYYVEARCDPSAEPCYIRDCTNPDDCPPNGLSTYKAYFVKAYDFPKCSDDSCGKECINGEIQCESIPCGESEDEICTGPQDEK